jgi:hypothetical protein
MQHSGQLTQLPPPLGTALPIGLLHYKITKIETNCFFFLSNKALFGYIPIDLVHSHRPVSLQRTIALLRKVHKTNFASTKTNSKQSKQKLIIWVLIETLNNKFHRLITLQKQTDTSWLPRNIFLAISLGGTK